MVENDDRVGLVLAHIEAAQRGRATRQTGPRLGRRDARHVLAPSGRTQTTEPVKRSTPCWADLLRTPCGLSRGHDHVCAGQRPRAEGLVCRPGSVPGRLTTHRSATIHLGPPLPTASCGPPAHSGGQPSSVRCSTLLRAGFTEPIRSPGSLVVSCTTVSPLPQALLQAVCSLWHCPAGCPGWVLPTALPFGARTFLDALGLTEYAAAARPTPPRWPS